MPVCALALENLVLRYVYMQLTYRIFRKEYKFKQNATIYMKLNLDRRNDYDDTLPDIGDQRGYRAGHFCYEWRLHHWVDVASGGLEGDERLGSPGGG